jgi:Sof1-like domain
VIGVLLDLNSLVEDGIGRLGYGKKVKVIHLKYTIRNGCRGKLEIKIPPNLCFEFDFFFFFRVSSSIYSADARFVLTGSGDGNVRIWKAKASDKLGVITARERAAMEYRESLKERWKVDSEVNKVARSVLYPFGPLYTLTCSSSVHPALAISQNQSTKLQNSNERCWKLSGSKRRGEENIRGKEKPIRNRRGKSWLLRNRAEIFLLAFFYVIFFLPVRWF